jgi:hypothetical protein
MTDARYKIEKYFNKIKNSNNAEKKSEYTRKLNYYEKLNGGSLADIKEPKYYPTVKQTILETLKTGYGDIREIVVDGIGRDFKILFAKNSIEKLLFEREIGKDQTIELCERDAKDVLKRIGLPSAIFEKFVQESNERRSQLHRESQPYA